MAGRFIRLNEDNVVVAVRVGPSIVNGEIASDTGEVGQIMQEDGTFITPEPTPPPKTEVEILREQLAQQAYEFMSFMDYFFTRHPEDA